MYVSQICTQKICNYIGDQKFQKPSQIGSKRECRSYNIRLVVCYYNFWSKIPWLSCLFKYNGLKKKKNKYTKTCARIRYSAEKYVNECIHLNLE